MEAGILEAVGPLPEGRSLRSAISRLELGLCFLLLTSALLLVGFGLSLWAFREILALWVAAPYATLFTGLVAIGIGGGILWIARRITR